MFESNRLRLMFDPTPGQEGVPPGAPAPEGLPPAEPAAPVAVGNPWPAHMQAMTDEQRAASYGSLLAEFTRRNQQPAEPVQPAAPPPEPEPTLAQLLAQVDERAVNGEFSTPDDVNNEKLRIALEASARENERKTEAAIASMLQKQESDRQTEAFLADHPNFEKAFDSGALDAYQKTLPYKLPPATAYLKMENEALKRNMAEIAKQEYARGVADQGAARTGVDSTKTVLDQPGSSMAAPRTMTPTESREDDRRIFREAMAKK